MPLGAVPIIPDREDFCKHHCPLGKVDRCYMCSSISVEDCYEWLSESRDNGACLYIFSNEKFPKRRVCPWCGAKEYNDEHFRVHGKRMKHALALETQILLWKEMVQVYRRGYWWAIQATWGRCQHCIEPGEVKCSMVTTVKNKNRCIFSIGLDPSAFCPDKSVWYKLAFVIL